jgi:hypothetical protein
MKRIILPFKMFWIALVRPQIFQKDIFAIVARMFETLAESTKQKMPLTTKLCMVDMTEGKDVTTLLSIWVGIGEESNPVSRCAELAAKVRELEAKKPTVSEGKLYEKAILTGTIPELANMRVPTDQKTPIVQGGKVRLDLSFLVKYLREQGVIVN